jgi:hypothetical protein
MNYCGYGKYFFSDIQTYQIASGVLKIIENILETALPFAIVVIVLYICCHKQETRDRMCSVVTSGIHRIMGRSTNKHHGGTIMLLKYNSRAVLSMTGFTGRVSWEQ